MSENEILVVLLGSGVLGFIVLFNNDIKRLPASHYLLAAYLALWLAWVASLLEHITFYSFFNVLEHIGYAANGLLLLIWCASSLHDGALKSHVND